MKPITACDRLRTTSNGGSLGKELPDDCTMVRA